jgi:hypothetical protein
MPHWIGSFVTSKASHAVGTLHAVLALNEGISQRDRHCALGAIGGEPVIQIGAATADNSVTVFHSGWYKDRCGTAERVRTIPQSYFNCQSLIVATISQEHHETVRVVCCGGGRDMRTQRIVVNPEDHTILTRSRNDPIVHQHVAPILPRSAAFA